MLWDGNEHGCVKNVLIYTSLYGVQRIEEIWDRINVKPIRAPDGGEFKPFPFDVFTLGYGGVVRVKGIYRVKARKARIYTPLGVIEATLWHKFMVIRARKVGSHRRWYAGYEIVWKRVNELEVKDDTNDTDSDYLLMKPYNGESWSFGVNPTLTYLAGYLYGDGTIMYGRVNAKTGKVVKHSRFEVWATDSDCEFLSKVAELCREAGATSSKVRRLSRENACELLAYGKAFITKLVPLVINIPINDLEAMRAWVAGLLDAEGYIDFNRNRVKIVSSSKELLDKLASLLLAIGIPSKIMNGGRSKGSLTYHLVIIDAKALYKLVEPYIIKKKDELKALAEVGDRVHAKIIRRVGDYIALRVKKVENTNEEDYFYDLVSSEDFTYLVNGIVSSNSHAIFT